MNNVNLDSVRIGAAPLGVGDESVVPQQMPAEKKILSGAGVVVSKAFDSLVDRLVREAEKTVDAQAQSRLSQAVTTIATRAGITKRSQLEALENCEKLTNQIAEDETNRKKLKAERARLEEEIAKAKERETAAANADGTEAVPPSDADGTEAVPPPDADGTEAVPPSEDGPSVKELEEQLAACNARIGALEKNIAEKSVQLNTELAKLDDKSSRVFAAAVRVSSSVSASYLEILRALGEDEGKHGELPAIDAFNRLLAGEDIEKVLMEELGIRG